jgi:hypothetical protein
MSLKRRIEALEEKFKPKPQIRFILSVDEMTDEPGVIWVLFEL